MNINHYQRTTCFALYSHRRAHLWRGRSRKSRKTFTNCFFFLSRVLMNQRCVTSDVAWFKWQLNAEILISYVVPSSLIDSWTKKKQRFKFGIHKKPRRNFLLEMYLTMRWANYGTNLNFGAATSQWLLGASRIRNSNWKYHRLCNIVNLCRKETIFVSTLMSTNILFA